MFEEYGGGIRGGIAFKLALFSRLCYDEHIVYVEKQDQSCLVVDYGSLRNDTSFLNHTGSIYLCIHVCLGKGVLEVDLVKEKPKCADQGHQNAKAAVCSCCCIYVTA